MKKIVLLGSALVLTIAGFAQFRVGLQATGNLGTASIEEMEDFDYKKSMRAMPGGGLVLEYHINERFSLRSGVQYQQNGVKLKTEVDPETEMKIELRNSLNYVQIPVMGVISLPAAGFRFYAGLGGYAGYGFNGKSKATLSYTMPDGEEASFDEEYEAFDKTENDGAGLKRGDYGLAAIAGIGLPGGFFVQTGYQHALSNIVREEDAGTYRNRQAQLTIGYFLGRK